MERKKDNRIKIFIGISALAVLLVVGLSVVGSDQKDSGEEISSGTPKIQFENKSQELGDVSMKEGEISGTFKFKNVGDGDLKLRGMKTTCMCTTAKLVIGDKKSPSFGMHNNPTYWSDVLRPGEEATIEFIFDPNAHGPDATGPITRGISVLSNDGGKNNAEMTFMFTGNVVK